MVMWCYLQKNEEQRKLFQEMNKKALIECDDRLSVSINEVVLMQYTDLKDKNGKQIYESDVVKLNTFKGVKKGTVIFKNACFWVLVKEFNTVSNVLFPLHDNEGCTKFEVIGNIYETSKLLEVV
jgi:uncharacterized phage protein (TIGR01671 family)